MRRVSLLSVVLLLLAPGLGSAAVRGRSRAATASVRVDQTVRTVDPRVFAINAAVWDPTLASGTAADVLAPLQLDMIRYPGGSLSDTYHWQTNRSEGEDFTWASGFDPFMQTIRGVGAQAMITVNYGTGSAEEAADWVAYANLTKQYGIRYWEIGNECYGGWERDDHAEPNDPYTYAVDAAAYIAAMKDVDPSIAIGVVGLEGEDSAFVRYTDHPATNPRTGVAHTGWTPVMLATLASLGVTPDFVVFHHYAQNPPSESDVELLQSARRWSGFAADLRHQVDDYLGAAGPGVELLVTENNSVSFNPGKQTTSLVNGLYLADSIGQILQTEFNSLAWWDLSNGQESNHNNAKGLYGWRKYGDYGIASPDHAQRYPTYYAMELLTHFARGGERVLPVTSDDGLLAAYAVERADGSIAVLVVNKSRTEACSLTIDLGAFAPASTAQTFTYGVPQDKAARTGRGSPSILVGTAPVAGSRFTVKVGKYSMSVVVVPPSSGR